MTVKLFMIPADVVAALPQYLLPSLHLRNNYYVMYVVRYETLYFIGLIPNGCIYCKNIYCKIYNFLQVRDNYLHNSVSLYIPSYKKDKHIS